jgi:chromosomal replication initiator protein
VPKGRACGEAFGRMASIAEEGNGPGSEIQAQWSRIRTRLRAEYGAAIYRNWFRSMTLIGIEGKTATIGVPTRLRRDWIEQHYRQRIRALWNAENKAIAEVQIVVFASAALAGEPDEPILPLAAASGAEGEDRDVGAPLNPRFTFENFVVGNPNQFAFEAARRVAESAASPKWSVPFNPLFLFGGVGLGKTHLMHAIAWQIRCNNPSRRLIYLSAEKFMEHFVRALRQNNTMPFKKMFRTVDVLLIDDFQFIGGKDSTQEEFFHTFNELMDLNRQIVISADKPPNELADIEERMRSRLAWGMVADVHPTTYELRLGILQSKAEQMKAALPLRLLEFLAQRITSNVRELEGALHRIVAHAQLVGREITIEVAEEVLPDLLRKAERRVSIDEIQKRVAEHYNIKLVDMHSARRARAVARPRQVAMYFCKHMTQRSLPEIGKKFGGRDHTTVIHAVRRIEELRVTDKTLAEDIDILKRILETGEKGAS